MEFDLELKKRRDVLFQKEKSLFVIEREKKNCEEKRILRLEAGDTQ